mmetsp:Transcript_1151/g.3615  ORF Transcript_1151/g.3615 Transcript_1151/m.3615 type:complete len:207 (+) Transcript_1151:567-1187(+)
MVPKAVLTPTCCRRCWSRMALSQRFLSVSKVDCTASTMPSRSSRLTFISWTRPVNRPSVPPAPLCRWIFASPSPQQIMSFICLAMSGIKRSRILRVVFPFRESMPRGEAHQPVSTLADNAENPNAPSQSEIAACPIMDRSTSSARKPCTVRSPEPRPIGTCPTSRSWYSSYWKCTSDSISVEMTIMRSGGRSLARRTYQGCWTHHS